MVMLQLPRELFLQVCAHLSSTELAALAGASKDHYLAVQAPLYADIELTASGRYGPEIRRPSRRLAKLVGSLNRRPVVSSVNAGRQLNWQWLKDPSLRQRHIKNLKLVLDFDKEHTLSATQLSRSIAAIPSTGNHLKIHLVIVGSQFDILAQLRYLTLHHVHKLVLYPGKFESTSLPIIFPTMMHIVKSRTFLWNLCLAGSTFLDLEELEMDTLHDSPDEVPGALSQAHLEPEHWLAQHAPFDGSWLDEDCHYPFYGLPFDDNDPGGNLRPLSGSKRMKGLKLQYTPFLDAAAVSALCNTDSPGNLTNLEIINPPMLHQVVVADLSALSNLLQRCLPRLHHLKLHLLPSFGHFATEEGATYRGNISVHPEHHLCNIVRELPSHLALPYICSRIFDPLQQTKQYKTEEPRTAPAISRLPASTFPRRLVAAGYRHRRLICWNYDCFQKEGEWNSMRVLASDQGEMISWEVVLDAPESEDTASWHLSGCQPVRVWMGGRS